MFVCSGNVARSAFAERYAALRAQRRRLELTFSSAGFEALDGSPMHPSFEAELVARGGTAAGFRSRQLEPELIADADLVLPMTLRQRHLLVSGYPWAQDAVHPLARFVRLAGSAGRQVGPAEYAHVLATGAVPFDSADDIADPQYAGPQVTAQVAQRIGDAVERLVALLE